MTHGPELLNVWSDPKQPMRTYSPHATRNDAVEELGEAVLDQTAHRYLGTIPIVAHPTQGAVALPTIDLMAEAHEYAQQSREESGAGIRTRDAA